MIRMLLVDDEDLSRFAFRTLLSRYFEHVEIVAEAENGQEAIEAVQLHQPDVIVMDIHMPGIDGLQTLEHVLKIDPNINVLICSAYDNFDYVSRAMDLGAKGYLLKPVTKEDLEEKLAKIKITNSDTETLTISSSISNQALVEILLAGSPGQALKHDIKRIYQDNLDYGILVLINKTVENSDDMISALNHVMSEVIPVNQFSLKAIIGTKILFYIAACDAAKCSGDCDNYNLISLADQVVDSLEQEMDISLKTISTIVTDGNWLESWHELNTDNLNTTATELEVNQITHEIINAAKKNNQDNAKILLAKWLEKVMPLSSDKRLVLVVQLIFLLNFLLEDMLLDVDYRNFHRIISGDISKNQPEMLELIVRQQLASTFESLNLNFEKKNELAEKVDIILQNESLRSVTLSTIAEEIGISSQYLCKTFKEETGNTFHKYLTSKRILLAKQLLADKNIAIKDISKQCGYHDTIYFTKLFKKINGITPSEYRNRL